MTDWDGRPQNPEQSGMHLLRSRLTGHLTGWYWNAATERFHHEHVTLGRAALLDRYVYEGPIHTPAEVATQVEAARREEREACAAEVEQTSHEHGSVTCCGNGSGSPPECCGDPEYHVAGWRIAAAIRARGDATKDTDRLNDCGGSDSCCQGPCKARY